MAPPQLNDQVLAAIQAQLAVYGYGVCAKPEGSTAAPAVNHQPTPAVTSAKPKPPPKPKPKPQPACDDNDSDDDNDNDNDNGNSGHRHLKHTRPPIHVEWVSEEPEGSPGRGKYRLRHVLGMTKPGYSIVRDIMKVLLMRTKGINMQAAPTYQRRALIDHVVLKGAKLLPEFEMYHHVEYWPLRAFIHMILRTKSEVHNRRLREGRKAEAEESKQKAGEENMVLGGQATAGAESLPKHVDNPDTTMAFDEAMENIVGEMSIMSVDPDKSTNSPDDQDHDGGAFDIHETVLDPINLVPVPVPARKSAPSSIGQAQSGLAPDPAPAGAPAPSNSFALTPLASTSAVPDPVPGLAQGSTPVLPDCSRSARSVHLTASQSSNSAAPAINAVPTVTGSSTPASSHTSVNTSLDLNLASLLTPDVLLQIQRLATLPEDMRICVPPMYLPLLQAFAPRSAPAPIPAPDAGLTPDPAPAPEPPNDFVGYESDTLSASSSNPPLDTECNDAVEEPVVTKGPATKGGKSKANVGTGKSASTRGGKGGNASGEADDKTGSQAGTSGGTKSRVVKGGKAKGPSTTTSTTTSSAKASSTKASGDTSGGAKGSAKGGRAKGEDGKGGGVAGTKGKGKAATIPDSDLNPGPPKPRMRNTRSANK
ncbi:hypothetical protein BDV93DRAFT_608199 [Ceratobasidium sp. AG-I]|nr:hypothetical protein BDV93DRAFT_608199 [Ceratobasidium sp. AG-I]